MTVAEFIDTRYWPKVQGTLSPAWERRTEDLLQLIKEGLGAFPIDNVPIEEVDDWWARLQKRFKTPVTMNKVLTRGRHMFKKAIRWGACSVNPLADIKKLREPERKFQPLTDEQHDALIEDASKNLKPYLVFARYTGARRSSLAKLEERDIDLTNNTITFRETKNGEDYTIPLHPKVREWCERALTGNPNRPLLPQYKDIHSISHLFRRLKARNGVKGFRFHDFRHNVGTKLAEKGFDVKVRMQMLGHKDPRMAIRYTHIAQEMLQKALTEAL